jgi:CelD/BcsL family acetyltransferase involved in cellulose biosynthesis
MAGAAEKLDPGELADDALLADWRRLAELRENPFLTPEWFGSWLQAHPAEEPFAIAWRRGGELRGVLPLVRTGRRPLRTLGPAGARRADWFTPACAAEEEAEMAAACAALLREERGGWELLRLDRVDDDSAWPRALWTAEGSRLAPAAPRRADVLPYIRFEEGGYEAYLAARSRNFRSQLGRRRRKLEREHGLEFRQTTGTDSLAGDMDVFFGLHEERWRDRGGSSSAEEAVQRFHRGFAAAALERGWLRLWTAWVDGEPGAAWYGWRIGGRYCYALSGLAKRYEPLALGSVLLAHTIESAAAEGASVYDLMWGDEGYKRRFETGRRTASTWVLGRRGTAPRAASALRTSLERRGRAVKRRVRDD